jgi:mRNA interferase HicA
MKYDDLFKLLRQNGWIELRQKGSHIIMKHLSGTANISVPYHAGKEVKKGMLQAILKKTGIKTTKR